MAINKRLTDTYGVLEINSVTFERTGNVASNYAFNESGKLENGMLVGINYASQEVVTGAGDVIGLHFSTEKEYAENKAGLNKFYLDKNSGFYPRVGILVENDRFTTTAIAYDTADFADFAAIKTAVATGVYGKQCATVGYKGLIELTKTAPTTGIKLKAIKATTVPNGENALQFAVIA